MGIRVEILGQFNPSNPFSAYDKDEAKVDRQSKDLTGVPRNWTAFCNIVDETLKEYTATKRMFKVWGTGSFVVLFAMIILVLLPLIIGRGREFYYYWICIYVLFMVPVYAVYFRVRGRVINITLKLEKICAENSGNGVRYMLEN